MSRVGRTSGRSVGRSGGWADGRAVGWTVGRADGRVSGRSDSRSGGRSDVKDLSDGLNNKIKMLQKGVGNVKSRISMLDAQVIQHGGAPRRFEQWKQEVKKEATSTATAASTVASWPPRIGRISTGSPPGIQQGMGGSECATSGASPPSEKAMATIRDKSAVMGDDFEASCRWLQRLVSNHEVCCEVLAAEHEEPNMGATRSM